MDLLDKMKQHIQISITILQTVVQFNANIVRAISYIHFTAVGSGQH